MSATPHFAQNKSRCKDLCALSLHNLWYMLLSSAPHQCSPDLRFLFISQIHFFEFALPFLYTLNEMFMTHSYIFLSGLWSNFILLLKLPTVLVRHQLLWQNTHYKQFRQKRKHLDSFSLVCGQLFPSRMDQDETEDHDIKS